MRRWRQGCLIGLSLLGLPTLARAEPPPDLPQDFLATFQAIDTAYANRDVETILRHYAPDCAFILVPNTLREIPLSEVQKAVGYKASLEIVDGPRERHDLAWQRQQLQQFFAPLSESSFSPTSPGSSLQWYLRHVKITSYFQKTFLNRKSTELRVTVKRTFYLSYGHPQGMRDELDEEIWSKNARGWQLKHRTIHPGLGQSILML